MTELLHADHLKEQAESLKRKAGHDIETRNAIRELEHLLTLSRAIIESNYGEERRQAIQELEEFLR